MTILLKSITKTSWEGIATTRFPFAEHVLLFKENKKPSENAKIAKMFSCTL